MIHRHRWVVQASYKVEDVSFGVPGISGTQVLRRCEVCGKLKPKRISGYWSIEQLRKGQL